MLGTASAPARLSTTVRRPEDGGEQVGTELLCRPQTSFGNVEITLAAQAAKRIRRNGSLLLFVSAFGQQFALTGVKSSTQGNEAACIGMPLGITAERHRAGW